MEHFKQILSIFLITAFLGIQEAPVLDDPAHFAEPDPDCPICLAAQTSACIDQDDTFGFVPDNVFFLHETVPSLPSKINFRLILSTRAPPF